MAEIQTHYIARSEDLFPAASADALTQYVNSEIGYKNISKNPDKFGNQIITVDYAQVVQINEGNAGNHPFTIMQIMDENVDNYMVYYFGEIPEVLEDDYVKVYGLPLGTTSFDNVGGGTTLAAVLGGCWVEKISE